MSGGSWDYVYFKFEEVAERLSSSDAPERRALGSLVSRVASAMHDIEWADSNDYAKGDELPAIRAALGGNADALILAEAIHAAKAERDRLDKAIKKAESHTLG